MTAAPFAAPLISVPLSSSVGSAEVLLDTDGTIGIRADGAFVAAFDRDASGQLVRIMSALIEIGDVSCD